MLRLHVPLFFERHTTVLINCPLNFPDCALTINRFIYFIFVIQYIYFTAHLTDMFLQFKLHKKNVFFGGGCHCFKKIMKCLSL